MVKPVAPVPPKPGSRVAGIAPTGDPFTFWDGYYKSHNESPADFQQTVAELAKDKNYPHVEAAIKRYIQHHGKQAEPWMYEWLVKAIEARKHSDDEVRMAVSYAAVLAKKTRNPTDLIRVADMMVLRNLYGSIGSPGYQTNIGELVDQAAALVPLNIFPPMMSVNLAVRTKDPARMADAAERLLALGWPGIDDKMRSDLDQQVEILRKSLQDEGRSADAEAMGQKIDASKVRDLYVSLKWQGVDDLDIAVEEPGGGTAQFRTPRTVFGGAILKNGYGSHPEEVYACPRAFDGTYTIRVDPISFDEAKPVKQATLTVITREGGPDEKRQEYRINLDKPEPVTLKLTWGRRKEVLPFIAPPEPPPALTPKAPVTVPGRPVVRDNKPKPR